MKCWTIDSRMPAWICIIEISFDERDKCTVIELRSKGDRYNPFETEAEDEVHLGVTILKNTAKRLDYRFDGENNFLNIEL